VLAASHIFLAANNNLKKATEPLGGVFAPNPTWHSLQSKSLVSVHPLGGCVMGEDASSGVVNHKGQVFAGASGTTVYPNLVCGRWRGAAAAAGCESRRSPSPR
jgi:cholesterol oxidase